MSFTLIGRLLPIDAFEEMHARLEADKKQGADPEDKDEYRAASVFWVPKEARWSVLQKNAVSPRSRLQYRWRLNLAIQPAKSYGLDDSWSGPLRVRFRC